MKARTSLLLALLLGSAGTLAACHKGDAPQDSESGVPSEVANEAAPDGKPGITAGSGRLLLPIVPGRPGVAYFSVTNTSKGAVALASVHIDGVGKAEMHKTSGGSMTPVASVPIASGAVATFAPGGLHVMVFDLDPTLKPGTETEATLTFADRDKVSLPLKVQAMADAGGMGGMAGMHH